MLKKIKKAICLLNVACLSLAGTFIIGCKDKPNEEPPYEEPPVVFVPENCEVIVEDTLFGNITDCNGFITICGTYEELKQECLKHGYDFFDYDDRETNLYDTDAGKIIRGFTDEDFADKALVVCAIYCTGFYSQYRIEEVEVAGNELTLKICCLSSDTVSLMINVSFLIAGVEKSLVDGVTDLEYVLRYYKI